MKEKRRNLEVSGVSALLEEKNPQQFKQKTSTKHRKINQNKAKNYQY